MKKGGYSTFPGAEQDLPLLHYNEVPSAFLQKRASKVNVFRVVLHGVLNSDQVQGEISGSIDKRLNLRIKTKNPSSPLIMLRHSAHLFLLYQLVFHIAKAKLVRSPYLDQAISAVYLAQYVWGTDISQLPQGSALRDQI